MVALPKKWVRELGLQQGSEVTITKLNSRTLLVNAQPEVAQGSGREAVVEFDSYASSDTIFRKVVSLYVLGYNRIILESPKGPFTSSKKLALKDMIRRHLIGAEGIAESRDRLAVHVLLGYSELSVENALKKMLLIIESLRKDAVLALENNDAVLAETTAERQDEVGRFGLYVIRQLNLSLAQGVLTDLRLENRDTLGYILVARALEKIAYHASNLTQAVIGLDKPIPKPIVTKVTAMNQAACGLVDEAMLSLFKRDHEGADSVIEKSKAFGGRETEVIKSLNGHDPQTYYALHVLMDSQRRIAEYASQIGEVVLDMTVERTLSALEIEVPAIATV